MKYRIEYVKETKLDKIYLEDDFAENSLEVKTFVKEKRHPIKRIVKMYRDGAGIDVTNKYIKKEGV